jgi:hypothetical protein
MTSFRGEVKSLVPCHKTLWYIKDLYEYKGNTMHGKLKCHFSPSFSYITTKCLSLVTARALVDELGMIQLRWGCLIDQKWLQWKGCHPITVTAVKHRRYHRKRLWLFMLLSAERTEENHKTPQVTQITWHFRHLWNTAGPYEVVFCHHTTAGPHDANWKWTPNIGDKCKINEHEITGSWLWGGGGPSASEAGPGVIHLTMTNYQCLQQFTYSHIHVNLLLTLWPLNAFRSWWAWVPPVSFVPSWSRWSSFARRSRKTLQTNFM